MKASIKEGKSKVEAILDMPDTSKAHEKRFSGIMQYLAKNTFKEWNKYQ